MKLRCTKAPGPSMRERKCMQAELAVQRRYWYSGTKKWGQKNGVF